MAAKRKKGRWRRTSPFTWEYSIRNDVRGRIEMSFTGWYVVFGWNRNNTHYSRIGMADTLDDAKFMLELANR